MTEQISNFLSGKKNEKVDVTGEIMMANPRADEFLNNLLLIKFGGESIFEKLYSKINDFGGPDNFTELMQRIYIAWFQSSYFFGEANTLDYRSDKILGFYDTTHNFKLIQGGRKIKITEVTGYYLLQLAIPAIPRLYREKDIGIVGVYDPISLLNVNKIEQVGEMQIPELVPAFFLQGLDDKAATENLEAGIVLVFDILTTFTGIGNLMKFRRLLVLLKAAKGAVSVNKTLVVIKIGVSGLEILSGTLGAMITLSNSCDSSFVKNYALFCSGWTWQH